MLLSTYRRASLLLVGGLAFGVGSYSGANSTPTGALQEAAQDAKGLSSFVIQNTKPVFGDLATLAKARSPEQAAAPVGRILGQCREGNLSCHAAVRATFPGIYLVATSWSGAALAGYGALTRQVRLFHQRPGQLPS